MIKKFLTSLIFITFIISITGCVAVRPRYAPPPPKRIVRTIAPGPNYFWAQGHWKWRNSNWYWANGYWAKKRPGRVWVGGHWVKRGGRWEWRPGHWRR